MKNLNLINVIGNTLLFAAITSIVICFMYAALTGSNLIAHFNF